MSKTTITTQVTSATPTSTSTPVASDKKLTKIEKDGLVLSTLMNEYKTKSAVIRHLHSKGYTRSEISQFMNIIYQHVRNVLVQDAMKQATKSK